MKKAIVLLLAAVLAMPTLPALAQSDKPSTEERKAKREERKAKREAKREAAREKREAKRDAKRNKSAAPEAVEKK
jgi:Ni/Co efflux regulator RcnB